MKRSLFLVNNTWKLSRALSCPVTLGVGCCCPSRVVCRVFCSRHAIIIPSCYFDWAETPPPPPPLPGTLDPSTYFLWLLPALFLFLMNGRLDPFYSAIRRPQGGTEWDLSPSWAQLLTRMQTDELRWIGGWQDTSWGLWFWFSHIRKHQSGLSSRDYLLLNRSCANCLLEHHCGPTPTWLRCYFLHWGVKVFTLKVYF